LHAGMAQSLYSGVHLLAPLSPPSCAERLTLCARHLTQCPPVPPTVPPLHAHPRFSKFADTSKVVSFHNEAILLTMDIICSVRGCAKACVCLCVLICVRACVCACVCARVRAYVCVRACVLSRMLQRMTLEWEWMKCSGHNARDAAVPPALPCRWPFLSTLGSSPLRSPPRSSTSSCPSCTQQQSTRARPTCAGG